MPHGRAGLIARHGSGGLCQGRGLSRRLRVSPPARDLPRKVPVEVPVHAVGARGRSAERWGGAYSPLGAGPARARGRRGGMGVPSGRPKIIRPAEVCSTLVTTSATSSLILSREFSATTIVPSSR